jgi:prephenate dehydratase
MIIGVWSEQVPYLFFILRRPLLAKDSSKDSIIVAFQGVPGANSEVAIRQHFGESVKTLPCDTFPELYAAVESGTATHALQPVENSLAGSVANAYELLFEHDLRIQAELIMRIRYALMAPAGTKMSDVKSVRSHPQSLAQCARYLKRRNMQPVVWFDNAGSARDLADAPEPNVAAIAPPLAAELYGLEILEQGIEDEHFNYTRFFVLGHGDPEPGEKNKTSIVFALQDRAGALYESLGEFATRGINLTKIESRPRRNKPWQYYFYVDFEGHSKDPKCEEALMALLRRSAILKMLGSYPAAKQPEEDRSEN